MDGVGEWTTTSLAIGRGSSIEVVKEIHFLTLWVYSTQQSRTT